MPADGGCYCPRVLRAETDTAGGWLWEVVLYEGEHVEIYPVGHDTDPETLSDAELATMCWYVKGVVEKTKLSDPMSVDKDALVPGGLIPGSTTPNSSQPKPPDSEDKLVIPSGLNWECRKNSF